MVDTHSHLLYGVDDGPQQLSESLQLLEHAVKQGITAIITTPHAKHPMYDVPYENVLHQVHTLQLEIEKRAWPIKLFPGHEVRINENILESITMKQLYTLANSNYLLLELPSETIPFYCKEIIRLLVASGITPIIAHPERNGAIRQNVALLEQFIRDGALAQITAGSIAGHFGKKIQQFAMDLIEARLVHTYGSDVHNMSTRPLLFEAGLDYLEKMKQLDMVDLFLENNERILENKQLLIAEPFVISERKWWHLFTK